MIKCAFENGGNALLRHVVVDVIVYNANRHVLLGKRGTYKGKKILESGKWSLLGGYLDRDETIVEAAKREVLEESGWELKNITLLRINDSPNRPKEDRQNVEFVYHAQALKQTKTSTEEVTSLQWFDLDNLPDPSDVAFDHYESLSMFKEYCSKNNL